MKLRTGVVGSQWDDEGPATEDWEPLAFAGLVQELTAEAAAVERLPRNRLRRGLCVAVEGDDTDLTYTLIEEVLEHHTDIYEWACEHCREGNKPYAENGEPNAVGKGCSNCNDGFGHLDDRFVLLVGKDKHPCVCVERWYEVVADDTELEAWD